MLLAPSFVPLLLNAPSSVAPLLVVVTVIPDSVVAGALDDDVVSPNRSMQIVAKNVRAKAVEAKQIRQPVDCLSLFLFYILPLTLGETRFAWGHTVVYYPFGVKP